MTWFAKELCLYDRIGRLPVKFVLSLLGAGHFNYKGNSIPLNHTRLRTFKEKGITCVSCGITGSFFAVEKSGCFPYHLNLYADKEGKEILMTVDHIKPKSKGGATMLDNLQPMCAKCNTKKADKYMEEVFVT